MLKQCNSREYAKHPLLLPLNTVGRYSWALLPVSLWFNLVITKDFSFLKSQCYSIGFCVCQAPSPCLVAVTTLMSDGPEAGHIDGSLKTDAWTPGHEIMSWTPKPRALLTAFLISSSPKFALGDDWCPKEVIGPRRWLISWPNSWLCVLSPVCFVTISNVMSTGDVSSWF